MAKDVRISEVNLHKYAYCNLSKPIEEYPLKVVQRNGEKQYIALIHGTPDWCQCCNGTGGRSDWDVRGLDIDVMLEDDPDGEMREAYFGGKTDVPCTSCNGTGMIVVPDYDNLNELEAELLEADSKAHEQDSIDAAVYRAECGYQW